MTDYKPGEIVNGHVLTSDGRWIPLTPPAPSMPQVVVVQNASASIAAPTMASTGTPRTGISTGEHVLHAILTLSTFGLWGIVWIIRVSTGGKGPRTTTIAFPAQPQQLPQQQPQAQPQQQPPPYHQWQQPPPHQHWQQPPPHQHQHWQQPQPQPRPEQTQVLPDIRPTEGPQDSRVWPPRS